MLIDFAKKSVPQSTTDAVYAFFPLYALIPGVLLSDLVMLASFMESPGDATGDLMILIVPLFLIPPAIITPLWIIPNIIRWVLRKPKVVHAIKPVSTRSLIAAMAGFLTYLLVVAGLLFELLPLIIPSIAYHLFIGAFTSYHLWMLLSFINSTFGKHEPDDTILDDIAI